MKASDKHKTQAWLWKKYKGKCFYCKAQLSKLSATIDHYRPRHMGGSNDRHNLRLSCGPCNYKKGGKYPLAEVLDALGSRRESDVLDEGAASSQEQGRQDQGAVFCEGVEGPSRAGCEAAGPEGETQSLVVEQLQDHKTFTD